MHFVHVNISPFKIAFLLLKIAIYMAKCKYLLAFYSQMQEKLRFQSKSKRRQVQRNLSEYALKIIAKIRK